MSGKFSFGPWIASDKDNCVLCGSMAVSIREFSEDTTAGWREGINYRCGHCGHYWVDERLTPAAAG